MMRAIFCALGPRPCSNSLLQQIGLHAQVRIHQLHPPVLIFHGLHLADQRRTGNGPLARQPSRELVPSVPTSRAGNVAVPAHENVAEVGLSPQQISDAAPPPKPRPLQANARRRSCRVARPSRCMIDRWSGVWILGGADRRWSCVCCCRTKADGKASRKKGSAARESSMSDMLKSGGNSQSISSFVSCCPCWNK